MYALKQSLKDEIAIAPGLLNLRRYSHLLENSGQDVLLWGHLGLGDQILQSRAMNHWLRSGRRVYIPVRQQNLNAISDLFGHHRNLHFEPISDDQQQEPEEVERISADLGLPLVRGGGIQFRMLRALFPDYGMNRRLSMGFGVFVNQLFDPELRRILKPKYSYTNSLPPYAFIDHHPGTNREIPLHQLARIREKGLLLIFNDRQRPFRELINLLLNANELHLVSSAPLCLAVVLGCQPKVALHYRTQHIPSLLVGEGVENWGQEACVGFDSLQVSSCFYQPIGKLRAHLRGTVLSYLDFLDAPKAQM